MQAPGPARRIPIPCAAWAPFAVCMLLAACGGGERQTYTVRGRYLMPVFEGEAMLVDHEAVPGYMEAMRMNFKVRDPSELADLEPGDLIRFSMVVTPYDAYVEAVERLPEGTALDLAEPSSIEDPDSTRSEDVDAAGSDPEG